MARDKITEGAQSRKRGGLAETIAAILLRMKGYHILARRYGTPVGEIDIIAKRGSVVVYVEVKWRAHMEDALAAVPVHTQARITRAAGWHSKATGVCGGVQRFDVIAMAPWSMPRHIENAWMVP